MLKSSVKWRWIGLLNSEKRGKSYVMDVGLFLEGVDFWNSDSGNTRIQGPGGEE